MRPYILEHPKEFDRLEKQSRNKSYNYESELVDFHPLEDGVILDAGCGSGVVSRYLASQYPQAKIIGCDYSEQRITQAKSFIDKEKDSSYSNIHFNLQNLTQLSYETSSFDGIVCRYVLEHMTNDEVFKALEEFYRCMRVGGKLCITDIDGLIYNMFPRTTILKNGFAEISRYEGIDFNIGRKLPHLATIAGFKNLKWKIETLQFQGEEIEQEAEMVKERYDLMIPALSAAMGGELKARQFIHEYMACLKKPGAVLFYNKFIITAEK